MNDKAKNLDALDRVVITPRIAPQVRDALRIAAQADGVHMEDKLETILRAALGRELMFLEGRRPVAS